MKNKNSLIILLLILFSIFIGIGTIVTIKIEPVANKDLNIFMFHTDKRYFTDNDISTLEKAGYDTSFLNPTLLEVSTFRDNETMDVIGTNENFKYLSRLHMISGSWFNGIQVGKKSLVAIVSETIAFQFYGTTDILNSTIEIDGFSYDVIGVVTDVQNQGAIYIPYNNLSTYHGIKIGYSQIWSEIKNEQEVNIFIKIMGYNSKDIKVFKMGDYQTIVNMRMKSIVFLIGLLITISLYKKVRKLLNLIRTMITDFTKNYYLTDINILLKRRRFLIHSCKVIVYSTIIIFIFKYTWFKVYLPDVIMQNERYEIIEKALHLLYYYMLPDGSISKYLDLNVWNIISIIMFVLLLMIGAMIVVLLNGNIKNVVGDEV